MIGKVVVERTLLWARMVGKDEYFIGYAEVVGSLPVFPLIDELCAYRVVGPDGRILYFETATGICVGESLELAREVYTLFGVLLDRQGRQKFIARLLETKKQVRRVSKETFWREAVI